MSPFVLSLEKVKIWVIFLSNTFVSNCLKSVNARKDHHKLQIHLPRFGIVHFIMELQKN